RCSNGNFGAVQIHGGHHNTVDNNLFVDCRYGVSFTPWGQKRWCQYLASDRGAALTLTNVNVRVQPYKKRYPELADLGVKADANSVWRNLFAGSEKKLHKQPPQTDTWGNRRIDAFNALQDSCVDTAFRAPHVDMAGLYADPMRAAE
ncbi:MAG: hypothetical protein PHG71_04960, partial [Kiritimatiellae bacterium]|nr:hypothetical protein [Kiritimatiellia bacterium]